MILGDEREFYPTTHKAGAQFQITIPKRIVNSIGIERWDELKVKISRTGKRNERRRTLAKTFGDSNKNRESVKVTAEVQQEPEIDKIASEPDAELFEENEKPEFEIPKPKEELNSEEQELFDSLVSKPDQKQILLAQARIQARDPHSELDELGIGKVLTLFDEHMKKSFS